MQRAKSNLAAFLSIALLSAVGCTDTPPLLPSPDVDSGAGVSDAGIDVGASGLDASGADDRGQPADAPASPGDAQSDNGGACVDEDRDGYPATECGGMAADCDDRNDRVNPGRTEVCDRADLDEDCNPCTVAGASDGDGDSDTFLSETCANTFRGATPTCPSAVRVRSGRVTGTDCEDSDANVRPNQTEACNNRDDNCNGMTDEDVAVSSWFLDRDGDGHGGRTEMAVMACSAPSPRHVRVNDDCEDSDPLVAPSAPEVCDGAMRDENCNGMQNEGCGCSPVGASRMCCEGRGTQTCTTTPMGANWSACSATSTMEVCDNVDNDCDGATDEGLRVTCYRDADGDGFAPMGAMAESLCPPGSMAGMCPSGFTTRAPTNATTSDCDDTSSIARSRFPGNREQCNNVDDNCAGGVDEGCGCMLGASETCYGGPAGTAGVGPCRSGTRRCEATSTGGVMWGACVGQVLPATEVCDGVDNNCNRATDENATTESCGRGACARSTSTCVGGRPASCVPGTPTGETCNNVDDNCDGAVDNGVTRGCSNGECSNGTQACSAGAWGGCVGASRRCPQVSGFSINGLGCTYYNSAGGSYGWGQATAGDNTVVATIPVPDPLFGRAGLRIDVRFNVHQGRPGSGNGSCCVTGSTNYDNYASCDGGSQSVNISGAAFAGDQTVYLTGCNPGGSVRIYKRSGGNTCCCGCSRRADSVVFTGLIPAEDGVRTCVW